MTTPNPYVSKDKPSASSFAPFTHITSNLKTVVNLDLGPLTFICGPNRAYKTAIRQSIRLALQRQLVVQNKKTPLKLPSQLIKFAADRNVGLSINLQSASGFVEFRMPVEEGKAKEPLPRRATDALDALTDEDWLNAFPMDTVREMLFLDSRKTREAVVRVFATGADVRPPLGLSPLQKEMWNAGLKDVLQGQPSLDPATALTEISKWARDQKPKKTRKANTKEESLATIKTVASMTGLEALPDLEAKFSEAQRWETSATAREQQERLLKALPELEEQHRRAATAEKEAAADHFAKLEDFGKRSIEASLKLSEISERIKDVNRRLGYAEALHRDLAERVKTNNGSCPMCGQAPGVEALQKRDLSITSILKKRREEFELLQLAHAEAKQIKDKIEFAQRDHQRDYEDKIRRFAAATSEAKTKVEMTKRDLASVKVVLAAVPASYSGPSTVELREKIDALKGAERARETYEKEMVEVRRLHEESAACKVVETEAQNILKDLVVRSKESAETRVNAFMPSEFRAELQSDDDGCEWRVYGDDGQAHDASSSGSEFGSLIIAMAQALPGKIKIIDLDDQDLHAFDPENIQGLWSALAKGVASKSITQAIVVHNRPDEAPSRDDGWLILRRVPIGRADMTKSVGPIVIEPSNSEALTSI